MAVVSAVNDTVVQGESAESLGSVTSNMGPRNRRNGILYSNLPVTVSNIACSLGDGVTSEIS